MRTFFTLFIVTAVAQAIDVDWSKVDRMEVFPEDIAGVIDEAIRREEPQVGSRIVGGEEATPGQFPHQICLFATTPGGVGFCGGSILNEEWILTAAHCVDTASSIYVLVGAHNVREPEPEQRRIQVAQTIIHERWNRRNLQNDLALLRLSEPMTFSDRVQPTRLPRRSQANVSFAGETGIVSGWGKASDSATGINPTLRWTSNLITNHLKCILLHLGIVGMNHICLDGSNGRSPCNGDSGGPLVVVNNDGQLIQLGIVSFGSSRGCEAGRQSVYTRTSSYLDWIGNSTGGTVAIAD